MVLAVLYYVHRYIRLTIPYALIMGVIIAVLPHLAYGPAWINVLGSAEVSQEVTSGFIFPRHAEQMVGRTCCT